MGERIGTLSIGGTALPSPSDGAIIFEGSDEATLESLLSQPAYQAFREQTKGDYIALYERKF